MKGWKKTDNAKSRNSESGRKAIELSEKKTSRQGSIIRNKNNFIVIKWPIHQEVTVIINVFASTNRASNT